MQLQGQVSSPGADWRAEAGGGRQEAHTSVCLPSGFPEAEDTANLESFGGEDPRPELYLSSGPSLPSLLPRGLVQGLGSLGEWVRGRGHGGSSAVSLASLSPEEPHLPTTTGERWPGPSLLTTALPCPQACPSRPAQQSGGPGAQQPQAGWGERQTAAQRGDGRGGVGASQGGDFSPAQAASQVAGPTPTLLAPLWPS